MSTSKPKSAKLVAITFAPLSWPSCPIFATNILGRRPSSVAKVSDISKANLKFSSSDTSALYTPEIERIIALYLPNTFSIASEISPKVARFLAASMASDRIAPLPPEGELQISDNSFSTFFTSSWFLSFLVLFNLAICSSLTA